MRIIGGTLRGRRLLAPKSAAIRPTADRARETLFNMLAHGVVEFEGTIVADIYAGTGALGFEALSRGAVRAVFVDQNPAALELVRRNAAAFGMGNAVGVIRADARRLPPSDTPVDLVFLDPPYRQGLIPPTLLSLHRQGWVKTGSIIVIEAGHDEDIALPAFLDLVKDRTVGEAKFVVAAVKTPTVPLKDPLTLTLSPRRGDFHFPSPGGRGRARSARVRGLYRRPNNRSMSARESVM